MEDATLDTKYWPAWPGEDNREASDLALQDARREIWTGLPVVIMRGRGKGTLARVLGTGSGWVQIRLEPEDGSDPMLAEETEEMSKRAVDLNVVRGYEDIPAPPDMSSQASGGDDDGTQESGDGDGDGEIRVGDYVKVTEGNYEGKTGKVVNVDRGGGVLTLSIRNVSSIVLKRRAEVELSSRGAGADSPNWLGDGRPARYSSRRGVDWMNKRVQIVSTGQYGVVTRLAAAGGFVIALEQPESGVDEVIKRKDDIRMVGEDGGDEEGMSQMGDNEGAGEDATEAIGGRVRSGAGSNSPKVTATRGLGRRGRNQGGVPGPSSDRNAGGAADSEGASGAGGPNAAGRSAIGGVKRIARQGGARGRNGAAAAKRQQRDVTPEQYSQTRLEAARRARQDLIVNFLSRSKEKLERTMGMTTRPNLQEWLEKIQGCDEEEEEEDEDEYTPLVYQPACCPTCFLEKESADEFCWNAACWECPVYDPSAVPLMESALPIKGGFSALVQSPRKPGFIDYSNIPSIRVGGSPDALALRSKRQLEEEAELDRIQAQQHIGQRQALPKARPDPSAHDTDDSGGVDEEPHKTTTVNVFPSKFKAGRRRAELETIASPLVTYAIRAPSVWLGEERLKAQNGLMNGPVGYFGPGWKDGLVYDEPALPHGDQQDRSQTALDFRWRRGMVN